MPPSERIHTFRPVLHLLTGPKFVCWRSNPLTPLLIRTLKTNFTSGQFQFWLSTNRKWAGPHLRRVFPSWLQSHCDQQLDLKYSAFVGEWGHVLDQVTNISGMYPGEIDRCLWGSLGSNNFLHNGPSKYKSFVFEDAEQRETSEVVHRFYDSVDVSGENYVVLKLENL
jgi:hypothetical protein